MASMTPYASSRRRKKRGRGEGESSREAELGAQSPQQGGAHRQRHNTHGPGTYSFFSFDLNLCLMLCRLGAYVDE
jgi:hypothetical protein